VTAGLSVLGSSRLVILGGLAELCSGAISMGIGGYFSTKSEQDNYNYLFRQTQKRLEESSSAVLERQVNKIFKPYGINDLGIRTITESLLASDQYGSETDNQKNGPASFVLKFGDCLEPISNWQVFCSAATIGISYFLGGLIPMVCP
jgi:vacuolar iron transporter family protein